MGMFEDIGGALSGAGSSGIAMLTSLGGSLINAQSQRQTNERNEQNNWEMYRMQREDANNAHQRESADLLKAGLNPILGLKGNGSPVASGSAPTGTAPTIDVMSMMGALESLARVKKLNAETDILSPEANIKKRANNMIDDIGNLTGEATEYWLDKWHSVQKATDTISEKAQNQWKSIKENSQKPYNPKVGIDAARKYFQKGK